ncbi:MAG: hypothetical protein ACLP8S_01685 [Solirubrobacteraceae bacterium]
MSRPTHLGLGYVVGLVVASGAAGLFASTSVAPQALVAATAGGLAVGLIWRFGAGCATGLLALGALDALPGPNLETTIVVNSITAQDIFVAALMGLLLYENLRLRAAAGYARAFWLRLLVVWAAVFLAYYAFVVIRTWLTTPVPLEHAITFSRDMPYFAILLPLFVRPLRANRFRGAVLATLGAGAVLVAVTQIVALAGDTSLSFFVHTLKSETIDGLTRIYTSAYVIPFAAVPFGVGLTLFGETTRARLIGAVVAGTSAVAVALSLTRAMYVGETVGLTASFVVALARRDERARFGRRQLAKAVLVVAVGVGALIAYSPSAVHNSAISGVSQRVESLVQDVSGTAYDPDVAVRVREVTGIDAAIGSHWLLGIGSLDPTYDYVSDAVGGNIRNNDVSLFGAVAVIGVIGITIYAVPVFALLLGLLHHRWAGSRRSRLTWVSFGGLGWCVAAIASSTTLGFFFTPPAVVGSAFVLALVASYLDLHQARSLTV